VTKAAPGLSAISSSFTSKPPLPLETANMGLFRLSLAVAHKQMTMFNADWLRLEVTPDQFNVETVQAPHVRIHDLVLRVFGEHLHHTPLTAFGLNRNVHFQVGSLAARDQLGRILAPVEPWGPWAQELGLDGEHGGMTSLTMTQVDPEGRPAGGRINVKVEPSIRIGNGRTGVFVGVNDHYAADDARPSAAGRLMDLLEGNFQTSLSRSEQIIDHIMSLVANREV
jgi:hypothetical protein